MTERERFAGEAIVYATVVSFFLSLASGFWQLDLTLSGLGLTFVPMCPVVRVRWLLTLIRKEVR